MIHLSLALPLVNPPGSPLEPLTAQPTRLHPLPILTHLWLGVQHPADAEIHKVAAELPGVDSIVVTPTRWCEAHKLRVGTWERTWRSKLLLSQRMKLGLDSVRDRPKETQPDRHREEPEWSSCAPQPTPSAVPQV